MPAQERTQCTGVLGEPDTFDECLRGSLFEWCRAVATQLSECVRRRLFLRDFRESRHGHCKRTSVPNDRQLNF